MLIIKEIFILILKFSVLSTHMLFPNSCSSHPCYILGQRVKRLIYRSLIFYQRLKRSRWIICLRYQGLESS